MASLLICALHAMFDSLIESEIKTERTQAGPNRMQFVKISSVSLPECNKLYERGVGGRGGGT